MQKPLPGGDSAGHTPVHTAVADGRVGGGVVGQESPRMAT